MHLRSPVVSGGSMWSWFLVNPLPENKNQFLTLVQPVAVLVGVPIFGCGFYLILPLSASSLHQTLSRVQGGPYLWHTLWKPHVVIIVGLVLSLVTVLIFGAGV